MSSLKIANQLDEELSSLPLESRIQTIAERFSSPVFTTSLGMEDQVVTWAIASHGRSIKIVTLQTGRLFAETQDLIATTNKLYDIAIEEYDPKPSDIENYAETYGMDGFYESVEARKACCHIRKIVPLNKALENTDAWITGLRREQSLNRTSTPMAEWDEIRQIMKFNPIADWTTSDVKEAIAAHDIPVNPLHNRNYPSIGCEPCTRAIKPGEPERAGRWWWEQEGSQECGLHPTQQTAPSAAQQTSGHDA